LVVAVAEASITLLVVMAVQQVVVRQTVAVQLKVQLQLRLPAKETMAVQKTPEDLVVAVAAAQVVQARTVAAISAATVVQVARFPSPERR
jgi:hypothetical protein